VFARRRERVLPEGVAITLAIPFYSGVPFLARALRSILAQTDPTWSAVVCDEGREPGIEEVVRAFGGGRIRYTRNPGTIGIGRNFNRCIDVAETELVTVMHADDELMPDYCEKIGAAAARHPAAAAVFCRTRVIDERSEPRFSVPDFIKDTLIAPHASGDVIVRGEPGIYALLGGNFINAPTLCFRKTVLGERRFPIQYKFVLDLELTSQIVFDGDTIVGIRDRAYRYRRHDDAATSQYTRNQLRFREESEFYDRMQERARTRGWDRCVEAARKKRIIKLNIAYRSLKNAALLEVGDAMRGFKLLLDL